MRATGAALLAERARALATPRCEPDEAVVADRLPILIFAIGDAQLAVPLASIVAIVRPGKVTPLPRAIPPVYGVSAWHGRALTVLTIGADIASDLAEQRLIVLGDGRRAAVGLLVDAVDETRIVARSSLSIAEGGARVAMSLGMTDDAVLVLDADAMLNTARPES